MCTFTIHSGNKLSQASKTVQTFRRDTAEWRGDNAVVNVMVLPLCCTKAWQFSTLLMEPPICKYILKNLQIKCQGSKPRQFPP